MSKKTYTLELTADDLRGVEQLRGQNIGALIGKLYELEKQARADREAEDLRLPWRASGTPGGPNAWHCVTGDRPGDYDFLRTERQIKLMSAAPELLEALEAAKQWEASGWGQLNWDEKVRPLIERALRKVETGQP